MIVKDVSCKYVGSLVRVARLQHKQELEHDKSCKKSLMNSDDSDQRAHQFRLI